MKTTKILMLLMVLMTFQINFGQEKGTTKPADNANPISTTEVKTTEVTTLSNNPSTTVKKETTQNTTTKDNKVTTEKTCPPRCPISDSPTMIIILCLLQILIYILLLFIVFKILKKENFKLSDALKENFTIETTNQVNEGVQNTTTEQPKSSSRLMAFISTIVTLSLATCFTSFWIYGYLESGIAPALEGLSNVLLSLGLGIVPYAFNRLSSAINGK